jgi:hypothetical protein
MLLPYPWGMGVEADDSGFKWKIDNITVTLSNCYFRAHEIHLTKVLPPSEAAPGWSQKGPEMQIATYRSGVHKRGPFKLSMCLQIVGVRQFRSNTLEDPIPDAVSPVLSLFPTTFNTPELSDVKLVCEGETFLCHKFVLSCKSFWFIFVSVDNLLLSLQSGVQCSKRCFSPTPKRTGKLSSRT